MANLTTIILTLNEELNIRDCIESVVGISERIVVMDSYSTDRTVEIAQSLGADVLQNTFVDQATQFKYALDHAGIATTWFLRLDADERLTPASAHEIEMICAANASTEVNGIVVRFEVTFMGTKLRHGGMYPIKVLRVVKMGTGTIEAVNMDEHLVLLSGRSVELENDSLHLDYKDLSAWTDKHNRYSDREVLDFFHQGTAIDGARLSTRSARFKRMVKRRVYYRLPIGLRAYLYYLYRCYVRLAFLDGRSGRIFAFLQAYWYRYLVDAKIYERQLAMHVSPDEPDETDAS